MHFHGNNVHSAKEVFLNLSLFFILQNLILYSGFPASVGVVCFLVIGIYFIVHCCLLCCKRCKKTTVRRKTNSKCSLCMAFSIWFIAALCVWVCKIKILIRHFWKYFWRPWCILFSNSFCCFLFCCCCFCFSGGGKGDYK